MYGAKHRSGRPYAVQSNVDKGKALVDSVWLHALSCCIDWVMRLKYVVLPTFCLRYRNLWRRPIRSLCTIVMYCNQDGCNSLQIASWHSFYRTTNKGDEPTLCSRQSDGVRASENQGDDHTQDTAHIESEGTTCGRADTGAAREQSEAMSGGSGESGKFDTKDSSASLRARER